MALQEEEEEEEEHSLKNLPCFILTLRPISESFLMRFQFSYKNLSKALNHSYII